MKLNTFRQGKNICDRKRRSVGLESTIRDNVHTGDSQEGDRPKYLPGLPFKHSKEGDINMKNIYELAKQFWNNQKFNSY